MLSDVGLLVGKGRKGYLVTCVDWASRYLVARKVYACASEPVGERLRQMLRKLPDARRRTLTLDNGREEESLTLRCGVLVYQGQADTEEIELAWKSFVNSPHPK